MWLVWSEFHNISMRSCHSVQSTLRSIMGTLHVHAWAGSVSYQSRGKARASLQHRTCYERMLPRALPILRSNMRCLDDGVAASRANQTGALAAVT